MTTSEVPDSPPPPIMPNETPTITDATPSEKEKLNVEEGSTEAVDAVEEVTEVDTYKVVYLIIILQGIGVLMPWNMLLNISYDYFENYKLKENVNGTLQDTTYSSVFQNTMTVASQLPNLLLNLVNIFGSSGGELTSRIKICMIINGAVIFFTIVLAVIDSSTWVAAFFVLTIVSIIFLNGSNGIYQNSLFGMVSELPFTYTNAIIIGQNLCGTFITILAMLTKLVTDSIVIRAVLYFGLSLLTVVACYFTLEIMTKRKFFKAHVNRAKAIELKSVKESKSEEDDDKEEEEKPTTSLGFYYGVFKEAKGMLLNVYFLFFVTLAIFPNVQMYVADNKPGEPYTFFIPERYFMDFATFLNFNVFAFVGSLIANYVQVPGPKYIWIAVVARVWFLFYFPFANYLPATRKWPVLFESTWFFVFNGFLYAITSGYLSSLCMMYAPQTVAPHRARYAGMMAGFFLIFGIVSGLLFSIVIKVVITSVGPL